MKRLLAWVFLAVLLSSLIPGRISAESNSPPTFEWVRQFGTSSEDYAFSVIIDGSANFYVAGWTSGVLPGQTSSGGRDAFVRKYNSSGEMVWTSQFGTSGDDEAYSVILDSSGNVYVAGAVQGALPGQTSYGSYDAFLRKYTPRGNILWTSQFGSSSEDWAKSIALDGVDSVYVVGRTDGALPGQVSFGGRDAYMRKYYSTGDVAWTRQLGTSDWDEAHAVASDSFGNAYMTGYASGALPNQASSGGRDVFIHGYDSSGQELWTRQFGTSGNDYGEALTMDASGNIYVAGSVGGSLPAQTFLGIQDVFISKYDSLGNLSWTDQFGTSKEDSAQSLTIDGSGNLYVAGWIDGALPGQTALGNYDAFLREYDSSHGQLWTLQFGSTAHDIALSVAVDSFGNTYAAGWTAGSLPGQTSSGQGDAFVAKILGNVVPYGGFVTGGGWIDSPTGAYVTNPTLSGKATFGFVSRYQKGATIPTGETEFQFRAANLNFHSDSYEWLVVAGPRAQYEGIGTINGAGSYGFTLTVIDGQIGGGGSVDKIRMKIWDKTTDSIIYDNQLGAADGAHPAMAVAGGSIVIH